MPNLPIPWQWLRDLGIQTKGKNLDMKGLRDIANEVGERIFVMFFAGA